MQTPVQEERAGKIAAFLAPSLKLKERAESGEPLEERVHRFLIQHFGGYTATAGNIFGYWKDDTGKVSYGEHKEYKVALQEDGRLDVLKRFLADLAGDLEEECIYLEAGKEASFIYASETRRA